MTCIYLYLYLHLYLHLHLYVYLYLYLCVCVCTYVCVFLLIAVISTLWMSGRNYIFNTAVVNFTTWNRSLKRHDKFCVLACRGIAFVVVKSTNPFQELAGFSPRRSVSIQEQFTYHFCGGIHSLTQNFLPVLWGFPRHCQTVEAQCAKRSAKNKHFACDVIQI